MSLSQVTRTALADVAWTATAFMVPVTGMAATQTADARQQDKSAEC